jgi:predicted NUDIX family NTP pyrophosphohydrolase
VSAGLLLHRRRAERQVLLVLPGGPFWRGKDAGAWQMPKGMIEPGEVPADAALREFAEETGHRPAGGEPIPLGEVRQAGGKRVIGFALAGEFDPADLVSSRVTLEWPRGSGRTIDFPEVDRAAWFGLAEAGAMILPSQRPLLDRLAELLEAGDG